MTVQVIPKERQAKGAFNGGEIVENKPIGFPREGGVLRPYSNLFYWAYAEAKVDSTIGLHPHEGFEIMSFVLKGNIRHFDTKMNDWKPLQAGDVQIIRAGNGISHAEFIAAGASIFQIWVDPDLSKSLQVPASYDDYAAADLPTDYVGGVTVTTYIGPGSPFQLTAEGIEARLYAFDLAARSEDVLPEKTYSLYVLSGQYNINGQDVKADDFVVISTADKLEIVPAEAGKVFLFATPTRPSYQTYVEMMQHRMGTR